MHEVRLTIFGPPVPKARARTVQGKRGHFSYTPQPTVRAQETVKAAFLQSGQEPIPRGVALAVHLSFYLDRPPSAPKRRRYPNVLPDADNLAKLVLDALQGLAFYNDSEIVKLGIAKRYATYPEPARTEVWIRTL